MAKTRAQGTAALASTYGLNDPESLELGVLTARLADAADALKEAARTAEQEAREIIERLDEDG